MRYRLGLTHEADEYVQALGLDYPSCNGHNVDSRKGTKDTQKMQDYAWQEIIRAQLFDNPIEMGFGLRFRKCAEYLAIVLAEKCTSEEEIKAKVDKAARCMFAYSQCMAQSTNQLLVKTNKTLQIIPNVRGKAIMEDVDVIRKRNAFIAAMRSPGHRVHIKALTMTTRRGYSAIPTMDGTSPH
ncbi:hypothetical protein BO94DRAFT_228121 [Aspergillus sclerotioniger CBS 115572]|uniref:Uncharacterized protein n=1 Tax=Aspergillus sclerotioniger CBS 115572 TaxID=1450535 RepID=A0A317VMR7_9EURO|nr:hypothetical protein BO94DRAFT_228121 [Aspergillus sclerotioniger CBS 115572]PWY74521.1 hypothetical protein BO94DRAFT_228121 [Aspergillus sclerotioniger CBS 115572]